MSDDKQHALRIGELADRLIQAYIHRAGSEDTVLALGEVEAESDNLVRDLSALVLTLAYRAADSMTVYCLTDPQRRVVPEKLDDLQFRWNDGVERWALEKRGQTHG